MFTGRRKYDDNSTLSTTPYLPYYYLISLLPRLGVSDDISSKRKKKKKEEEKVINS